MHKIWKLSKQVYRPGPEPALNPEPDNTAQSELRIEKTTYTLGLKQLSLKHPPRTGPNFGGPQWETTYTQTGFEAIVYQASTKDCPDQTLQVCSEKNLIEKLGLKQLSVKHLPRTGPNFIGPQLEKTYTQTGFEAIVYTRASAKHSTTLWRSAVKNSQALRLYPQTIQLLS